MSAMHAPNHLRRCPCCRGPKMAGSATCATCAKVGASLAAFAESQSRARCGICETCRAIVRPGLRWCRACYQKRESNP